MASLAQIISRQFPGALWSMVSHADKAEAYATLNWSDPIIAKPTLQQLLDLEADTDTKIEADRVSGKRQDAFNGHRIDALLWALDAIIDGLVELNRAKRNEAGQTVNPAVVSRIQTVRTKLNEALAAS